MGENKRPGFFKSFLSKIKEEEPSSEENKESGEIPEHSPEENALFQLFQLWQESIGSKKSLEEYAQYEKWLLQPVLRTTHDEANMLEQAHFFMEQLGRNAMTIIDKVEAKAAEEKTEKDAINASVKIKMAKGYMAAFLFVFPPMQGGQDIKVGDIVEELTKNNVQKGIIDTVINRIGSEKRYFQIYIVAEGVYPIAGKDGEIIDLFPRTDEIDFEENEKGDVDFKNLNKFRRVQKDDVICTIIPPEEGTDGFDVTGRTISAKMGKTPAIPKGRNTSVSEDKKTLISTMDGYVSFEGGRFRVENKLIISGNVDMNVGNLDFLGDIVIQGDILNGFEVKATGNISVQGMVEGAIVTAGGNIRIEKGMNGNRQGILRAQGDVKCTFLENSTVYAGNFVYAESIVCCDIYCDNSVKVRSGKGVIIGGTITTKNVVDAKIIGSKANRETNIILGQMPNIVNEKRKLEEDIRNYRNTLQMLTKNVTYLQSLPSIPEAKKGVLIELVKQKNLYEEHLNGLKNKLRELEKSERDFSLCRLVCDALYPPTRVVISNYSAMISSYCVKCNIYLAERENEKEIVVGTL